MTLPGRTSTGNDYRYGFNGKEKDDEIMGEGSFQDYGMRMYNPRIGRFPNVDPLTKSFAYLTPYQFASNSPIAMIDLDGMEGSLGISGSANVASIGTPIIEFDTDRDLTPDYNGEFYKAAVVNYAFMGAVGVTTVSAPYVAAAYGSYSTWFVTTSFSSSLIEYGVFQTSFRLGTINALTNITGQYISSDYKFNENINWAQPIFAGAIGHPVLSNLGESSLNVYYEDGILKIAFNDRNKFIGTFLSNSIGNQINGKIEVNTQYNPVDNVFNTLTGTSVEVLENSIGDNTEKTLDSLDKKKGEIKKEKGKYETAKDNITSGPKRRLDLDFKNKL